MTRIQSEVTVEGTRLDRFVAQMAGVSRRIARTWISGGRVQLNGRIIRILTKPLRVGAKVSIETEESVQHSAPSITLLHIDSDIVVVDKPPRLLSETNRPGSPSLQSLVPGALRAAGEKKDKIWVVHRLDAQTSGVIVLARKSSIATLLGNAFRDAEVSKEYLAICQGDLRKQQWVDMPIGRKAGTRHAVRADGKAASTHFTPLSRSESGSLVLARPKTGRTHQIRVHLEHLGHPIIGDRLYDGRGYLSDGSTIPRVMLHARRLEVPLSSGRRTFEADIPADFLATLSAMGLDLPEA
jgi:23S rRNA pseudouridine1911/1915/1917 synthase